MAALTHVLEVSVCLDDSPRSADKKPSVATLYSPSILVNSKSKLGCERSEQNGGTVGIATSELQVQS